MKTKRIMPLLLITVVLLSSCTSHKSADVTAEDDGTTGDLIYPVDFVDIFNNSIIYRTEMESALCWDYSVLNSTLAATSDPSFIAGFNKEDMVGTLIYKLYPELENVTSIIKDGQVDVEAVKNSGSEYIFLTDELSKEYADIFKDAKLQTVFTSSGESKVIGRNTFQYICLGTNRLQRYTDISGMYYSSLPEDIQEQLTEMPFAERRTALFLGNTMNSVYTADYIFEIMDACMAKNAAEDLEITDGYIMEYNGVMTARYTEVTPQQLQEWNPDVIWVPYYADYTVEDVLNNPDFQNITAVKNGEVYTVPGALEPWYYPTLAIRLGTIWAAYTLYPDICPYERVVQEANSYYADVFNAEFTEEDMGLYRIK